MKRGLSLFAAAFIAGFFGTAGAGAAAPPTEGMLLATGPEGQALGPCPLEHTDVQVRISGFVARVVVTQKFHNPYDYKIEAVYVFPMSQSAAVDDMTMIVGDRVVRGVIKPRDQARRIYEAAKAAGHVASLLDQERPNIFTQSVANIEPGERVEIEIAYVETLDWEDGTYQFDFPMVVGPRYMPGAPKSAPVNVPDKLQPARRDVLKSRQVVEFVLHEAANAEQRAPMSEDQARACLLQAVAVQKPDQWRYAPWHAFTITYADGTTEDGDFYLDGQLGRIGDRYFCYNPDAPIPKGHGWAPDTDQVPDGSRISPPVVPEGRRAGHDIAVTVHVNAGLPLRELKSLQHEVAIEYLDSAESEAVVTLKNNKTIPNKDFVLVYKTITRDIGDAVVTHFDARGGFFTLILQPPERVQPEWIVPKEMIFVIDKSGSMSGFPIETAKKTMRMCIENLNPDDTFNLMTFAGGVGFCFDGPVPNTPENRTKALDYLSHLQGGGGTEMMKAIHACLGGEADPERVRIVCFMTDGYVGNDMAIIDAVKKNAGVARVFSFGIGRSVNRYLLDGMARAGRGEVEYVLSPEQCAEAAQRFYERVSTPVLTDIEIDWGDLAVEEIYPRLIPDLFSAKPVVIKGRYSTPGSGVLTLRGRRGSDEFERRIAVDFPGGESEDEAIASLWARAKVADLMNQDLSGAQLGRPDPAIKEQIVQLGLEYRLLTQYTSFVAVEELTVTRGGQPVKVQVPVEMPEGVSYEGVFGREPGRGGIAGTPLKLRASMAQVRHAGKRGAAASPQVNMLCNAGAAEVRELDMSAEDLLDRIQSDTKLTPKQKRERMLQIKLAAELHGLAVKVRDGQYTDGKVKVKNGKIEVAVYLADTSDATIARLKALGLDIFLQTKSAKLVIGSIDVSKLEALALLDAVRRVQLPAYSTGK